MSRASVEQQVFVEGIGNISIISSSRTRRMSIRLKPFEKVRVTIPARESQRQALHFIDNHREWILKGLEKIRKVESRHTYFDERSEFWTRFHSLAIRRESIPKPRGSIGEGKVVVAIPLDTDIRDLGIQLFIRYCLEKAMKKDALAYLPARTAYLASLFGMQHKGVAVRNSKARWGSCTHDNRILLNLHLMRLPEKLSDYIIMHELAHTVEKNHGPRFYDLLNKMAGDVKVLEKELKQYSLGIY